MNFLSLSARRGLATSLAGLFLGALIAGCSGSNTALSPVPQTKSPAGAARLLGTLHVSRASAAAIHAKVLRSSSHMKPLIGKMQGHRSMTSSANYDLVFGGGALMTGAKNYNILVNSADESPWGGQIAHFENDLFASTMMSILNQYNSNGTYTAAGDVQVTYNTTSTLQQADIQNIVHQVAQQYGNGYGNMYHVFLQSGVQDCSVAADGSACYGQQYCAYHNSTDYADIGHVIYSVEGYQDIQGCQESDGANSPNGSLVDSTASTLSHEMFEAFTDPDPNSGWNNSTFPPNGAEIGDLCAPAAGVNTAVVNLNGDNWEIQMEYSNSVHDCSYTP